MNDILTSQELYKSFGNKAAVKGIDISVRRGEIVGLLGPNGAGKTTTFYLIVGMIRADRGRILLNGHEITSLPMYRRAQLGISYLPQEPSVFRKLTVRDNLKAVLEIKGLSSTEIEEEIERLLDEFRLRDFSDRKGMFLSGGERRRTEIARTIALNPTFILFDEPFAGIDPIAMLELKNMIKYLKERGLGILLTDHNVRDTLSITDRAYIISNGSILEEGKPADLVENKKVREIYLGEEFAL
ncbi:lipopolysaccharide export system ATP-binding protein LptB [bacterium BMS3Bbin06]|nr:lipopolysaccharide export system ATP-binding protein LptB [bacterium BMS3Abin08]GBE35088.1 lipopolysaccharide export system ATP-binding protein LptB [bacterium BMS3Bbin06]HDO35065.1 LPS export ABC transporter ATP-binding protein [Nitrospirota bacterium]HDY71451.1 LPS export ABC transporter ATP-binding protein [Nitrospirota bacterium]